VVLLLQCLASVADDTITNIMSPIATYAIAQNLNTAVLMNGGAVSPVASYEYEENLKSEDVSQGGVVSPFASYQFQANLATDVLIHSEVITPLASYQHLENLNIEISSNGNLVSPIDSYFFYAWPGTVVISNQPSSCIDQAGSNAAFSVVVGGEPPFSYQWWFNNSPINGATNASLTISNVQSVNAGNYWVSIGNLYGSTNSTLVSLSLYSGIYVQGWTVRTYRNGSPVNGLADADALISGGFLIAETNMAEGDMVGFSTGEGTGHFSINNPVPGISNTQATDNYAVQGTGFLDVPSNGQCTFGLNTDDGARLKIDGINVIIDDVRSPPHDSAYVTVSLSAGLHPIEWTWFNEAGGVNGGGGEGECFAASGVHTGFDSAFQLVGNTPGLVVASAYSVPMNTLQTSRAPTTAEIVPVWAASPTSSQLLAYHGGTFTANLISIDPNEMTVVLTHGWRSDPNAWALGMADFIRNNLPSPGPNIVAWDWSQIANSALDDPGIPAAQTGIQGRDLGAALQLALGANYSKPIHFVGHSLGALVNASAANYLQGTNWANDEAVSATPWLATAMQMTLYDEAEVATGQEGLLNGIRTLAGWNGNPLLPKPFYYHPLPRQFAWADNYISAFGLLRPEAVNVILTNGFPMNAPDPATLFNELTAFHAYPMNWYDETIQNDGASVMGFRWSFEEGGWFSQAPATNSVYIEAFNDSEWDLTATNWNYGTNFLNGRFQAYQSELLDSGVQVVADTVLANGTVLGQAIWDLNTTEWVISLFNGSASSGASQFRPRPLGGPEGGNATNVPAYAWMQLAIPPNAISISFNYTIQGDWVSDSLAAAFNGTNVLLISGSEIQTNVTFSSGSIDVSALAGQTNEFFIGIVGGTSTNAQLTVQNFAFTITSSPSLQVQLSAGNLIFSWPMSAQSFSLQTTTSIADPDSWATLTNVPAIVNLQNVITNPIPGSQGFYRLVQLPH
jgi:pimeloyl-ACP methyl ester carboxylesterase